MAAAQLKNRTTGEVIDSRMASSIAMLSAADAGFPGGTTSRRSKIAIGPINFCEDFLKSVRRMRVGGNRTADDEIICALPDRLARAS